MGMSDDEMKDFVRRMDTARREVARERQQEQTQLMQGCGRPFLILGAIVALIGGAIWLFGQMDWGIFVLVIAGLLLIFGAWAYFEV